MISSSFSRPVSRADDDLSDLCRNIIYVDAVIGSAGSFTVMLRVIIDSFHQTLFKITDILVKPFYKGSAKGFCYVQNCSAFCKLDICQERTFSAGGRENQIGVRACLLDIVAFDVRFVWEQLLASAIKRSCAASFDVHYADFLHAGRARQTMWKAEKPWAPCADQRQRPGDFFFRAVLCHNAHNGSGSRGSDIGSIH